MGLCWREALFHSHTGCLELTQTFWGVGRKQRTSPLGKSFWLFHVVHPEMLPERNASEQPVGKMASVEWVWGRGGFLTMAGAVSLTSKSWQPGFLCLYSHTLPNSGGGFCAQDLSM